MFVDDKAVSIGSPGSIRVVVDDPKGYMTLGALIEVGDEMTTRIRRKELAGKKMEKKVFYTTSTIRIQEVETDENAIRIAGQMIDANGSGGRHNHWITDGCEFTLNKSKWTKLHMELIKKLKNPPKDLPIGKNSERNQERSIAEFRQTMNTSPEMIVFGSGECLQAADAGAVKILLATRDWMKQQTEERRKLLSDESGKYRNANIVIYEKTSTYYKELTGYGGVSAILQYEFHSY